MLSDILRWGGKRSGQPDAPRDARVARGGEPIVPSKALPKFLSAISNRPEAPVLIDFGPVIGTNVAFFGEHLGCKLYIEDLASEIDKHMRDKSRERLADTLTQRFTMADASVDGVLCWDIFDFLEPAAAKALARE